MSCSSSPCSGQCGVGVAGRGCVVCVVTPRLPTVTPSTHNSLVALVLVSLTLVLISLTLVLILPPPSFRPALTLVLISLTLMLISLTLVLVLPPPLFRPALALLSIQPLPLPSSYPCRHSSFLSCCARSCAVLTFIFVPHA
ncbi:unnamed protein product [Cyclocybe aegerita]|uniref:Uncharacterized protein n=1 Tax=Cyclocybe aegerita TaxID=1973307 RepID=A0A8S0WSP1_CYCAE|nr:unnamed protein product [Cyclocybe aegerita]